MLLAAANDLNIDLSSSILVGDRLFDIQARPFAGLPLLIHVITGHGKKERAEVEALGSKCQHIKSSRFKPSCLIRGSRCLLEFDQFNLNGKALPFGGVMCLFVNIIGAMKANF